MRVREPWVGRGGCPATGRAEPPLEGNWMKTGWKKAIAPLVLVAGAAALAACGGSSGGSSSSSSGSAGGGASGSTLIIGSDLPLQGASADASAGPNLAIHLLLKIGRASCRENS